MRLSSTIAILFLVSGLAGCGADTPPPPANVFPVSGKVTYDGAPLADAVVTFHNETANRSAFGRTDAQGEYTLSTFGENDGAVEGSNVVTITKVEAPAGGGNEADIESADYDPSAVEGSESEAPPKSLIPEKYGNRETSGLTATVIAGENPPINFDLAKEQPESVEK